MKKYLSLTLLSLIASLILSSISYSQNKRDPYENNNSRQAASNIVEGEIQEHTIYPSRDKDWLIFTSPKAGQYTVTFSNQSLDLKGVVYVQMGLLPPVELTTFNSLKPGKTWDVGMTPSQSNVKYFIGIWASNQDKTGKYEIEISEYNSNSNQKKKPISNVPTNGLIAYYPFNGNANDESNNGNNGSVRGSVTWIPDRFGNRESACNIQSKGSYILLPRLNIGDEYQDKTICGWFKLVNSSEWLTIIAQGENSSHRNHLCILPEHLVYYQQYNRDNNPYELKNFRIDMNGYHFIAAVCSNTFSENQKVKIYIDGVFRGGISSRNVIELNTDFSFGRFYDSNTGWEGTNQILDDIRIYNRALNEEEIQNLYNEGGWK